VAETIKDDSAVDATAPETGQGSDTSGGDRRNEERRGADRRDHVRVRPDETNRLAATLASGSDIRLIDLSKGGAQFECDRRFLPNATVSLRLLTSDGQVLVTGRVVRSRIVRLTSGGLGYLVAVAFTAPLQTELKGDEVEAGTPAASAPAAPAPAAPALPSSPAGTDSPATTAVAPTQPGPAAAAGLPAPVVPEPATSGESPAPEAPEADITAEEALAFEATIELAPAMMTVTASVDTTSEKLHDMFNGNDW
jgi:hypothetical protein